MSEETEHTVENELEWMVFHPECGGILVHRPRTGLYRCGECEKTFTREEYEALKPKQEPAP